MSCFWMSSYLCLFIYLCVNQILSHDTRYHVLFQDTHLCSPSSSLSGMLLMFCISYTFLNQGGEVSWLLTSRRLCSSDSSLAFFSLQSCSCLALWGFTLHLHGLRFNWAILQISRYLPPHNPFLSEIYLINSDSLVSSNSSFFVLTFIRLFGPVWGPFPSAAFWKLFCGTKPELRQGLSPFLLFPPGSQSELPVFNVW